MPAKRPEECDLLFGEYAASGDLEALLSLYEDGATLVSADGASHTGVEEIRKALSVLEKLRPKIRMNVFSVVEAVDNLAVLYNDAKSTIRDPDGLEREMVRRAVEVVRRQPDGTWRFVFDDPHARDRNPEQQQRG